MMFLDDRSEEDKKTHTVLVVGTDKFLSGWGRAENGASYAVWACRPEDSDRVERWVRNRGDMLRVRLASDPYRPKYAAHVHIYVVGEKHPSLS